MNQADAARPPKPKPNARFEPGSHLWFWFWKVCVSCAPAHDRCQMCRNFGAVARIFTFSRRILFSDAKNHMCHFFSFLHNLSTTLFSTEVTLFQEGSGAWQLCAGIWLPLFMIPCCLLHSMESSAGVSPGLMPKQLRFDSPHNKDDNMPCWNKTKPSQVEALSATPAKQTSLLTRACLQVGTSLLAVLHSGSSQGSCH